MKEYSSLLATKPRKISPNSDSESITSMSSKSQSSQCMAIKHPSAYNIKKNQYLSQNLVLKTSTENTLNSLNNSISPVNLLTSRSQVYSPRSINVHKLVGGKKYSLQISPRVENKRMAQKYKTMSRNNLEILSPGSLRSSKYGITSAKWRKGGSLHKDIIREPNVNRPLTSQQSIDESNSFSPLESSTPLLHKRLLKSRNYMLHKIRLEHKNKTYDHPGFVGKLAPVLTSQRVSTGGMMNIDYRKKDIIRNINTSILKLKQVPKYALSPAADVISRNYLL